MLRLSLNHQSMNTVHAISLRIQLSQQLFTILSIQKDSIQMLSLPVSGNQSKLVVQDSPLLVLIRISWQSSAARFTTKTPSTTWRRVQNYKRMQSGLKRTLLLLLILKMVLAPRNSCSSHMSSKSSSSCNSSTSSMPDYFLKESSTSSQVSSRIQSSSSFLFSQCWFKSPWLKLADRLPSAMLWTLSRTWFALLLGHLNFSGAFLSSSFQSSSSNALRWMKQHLMKVMVILWLLRWKELQSWKEKSQKLTMQSKTLLSIASNKSTPRMLKRKLELLLLTEWLIIYLKFK